MIGPFPSAQHRISVAAKGVARRITTIFLIAAGLLVATNAGAQSFPFPHTGTYAGGYLPSAISTSDAKATYDKWKSEYLKTDCGPGLARVEFNSPTGSTVSEGQGYGMILTAYYGDREAFDGLWTFAKKRFGSSGLMGWHVTCSGFTSGDGGETPATDGDTDIGLGLVVAYYQWGESYKADALAYLATLKKKDFNTCSGEIVMANNGFNNGCTSSNTSYWMPGHYRVFAEFTGDTWWTTAADSAIILWTKAANATTGLVSNEVDQNGAMTSPNVNYNGCRIPWRSVSDYLWYGTAGAKAFTDKITDWVDSKGPSNLVDGYQADGTPTGSWNGSDCFNGGYAVGAMSKSQDRVDRFAAYFKSLTFDNYYETSLRALYMLMLSGGFWRPGGGVPAPDGGMAMDGGSTHDGGATAGDAGISSDISSACGCTTGASASATTGALALALLGLRLRRLPRRPDGT